MIYPFPAVGVFIFQDESIFLIKKARGIFKGQWCTPGGKIEYGEKILDTVNREGYEETNLILKNIRFITYEETIEKCNNDIKYHFVFFNFAAEVISGIPKAADDASEIKLIKLNEIYKYSISEPTLRTLRLLKLI